MNRQGITLHIDGRDIFIPAESIASARVVGWNLNTSKSPDTKWVPDENQFQPPLVVAVASKMTGKLQVTLEFNLEGGGITESAVFAELPGDRQQLSTVRPLLLAPNGG